MSLFANTDIQPELPPSDNMVEKFVDPQTTIQEHLSELWSEILETKVGINDSFFELGGDSIKATIFFNRLQEKFGGIFYIVSLFEAPTIAEFELYLNRHYPEVAAKMLGHSPRITRADIRPRINSLEIAKLQQSIRTHLPLLEESTSKNSQAIFILSAARSGSTLLRIILAAHPNLFAPPQLCLLQFNTLNERKEILAGEYSFWREGTIHAIRKISDCSTQKAQSIMQQLEKQQLTTKEFFDWLQQQIEGRTLVDKTTTYAFSKETLACAETNFDRPIYIHLLRHPYGMIRSFEEAKLDLTLHPFIPKLKESDLLSLNRRELAEILWFISNQNIVEFLQDIPPERQYSLRFEDLVGNPEVTVKTLCQFLELDFYSEMLEPYGNSKQRMTEGLHSQSRMLGDLKFYQHKGINAEVAYQWQQYYQVDFLGEITWQLAQSLGYEQTIASLSDREEGEI